MHLIVPITACLMECWPLFIVNGIFNGIIAVFLDSNTIQAIEVLSEKGEGNFGQQRVFGAIAFAFGSVGAGATTATVLLLAGNILYIVQNELTFKIKILAARKYNIDHDSILRIDQKDITTQFHIHKKHISLFSRSSFVFVCCCLN